MPDDFLEDAAAGWETRVQALGAPATLPAAHATLDEAELSMIQRALKSHDGNVAATARALGVSRNTIYRKLAGTS